MTSVSESISSMSVFLWVGEDNQNNQTVKNVYIPQNITEPKALLI